MKIFITLMLLIVAVGSKAQSRLGSTEEAIRKDFSNQTFQSKVSKYGERIIYFEDEKAGKMMYYIDDSTKTCDFCVIYPISDPALNGLVENFNKNYVIINSKTWKMYKNGVTSVALITLNVDTEGKSYFAFMFDK